MSMRARLINTWLRTFDKPFLARTVDAAPIRKRFETIARLLFHAPRGTQMQWQALEADGRRVDALEIVPAALESDTVLLYIHGGAFIFGSPATHSAMLAHLGRRLQARAVLPRYRLAPEAAFPAAIDDVRTAWDGLRANGVDPRKIIIGGDSAGGALALSLLAQLVAEKTALPGGVFCFSPLTDLTCCGDSFSSNAKAEAVLPAARASDLMEMYLQGHPPDASDASPLYANFSGACPVWITVGDTEILQDDARRMVACLRDEKVPVTFEERADLPHVWPLFHNVLPEARETLDVLATWIRQQVPGSQGEN